MISPKTVAVYSHKTLKQWVNKVCPLSIVSDRCLDDATLLWKVFILMFVHVLTSVYTCVQVCVHEPIHMCVKIYLWCAYMYACWRIHVNREVHVCVYVDVVSSVQGVHLHVCVCVHRWTCVHVYGEVNIRCFPQPLSNFLWDKVSYRALSLLIRIDWISRKPQISLCPFLFTCKIINILCHATLLCEC